MIWTHHMKNITVHPSFRPTAAPQNETYEQGIISRLSYTLAHPDSLYYSHHCRGRCAVA